MKIKKWFTLIELIIVIIIIWVLLKISISVFSFDNLKKQVYFSNISNCNFIYYNSNKIKCYIDKNNNNLLDKKEIENWTNIIIKNKELYLIKNLKLQNDNYYFIYKSNYVFNYNIKTHIIKNLNSIF